MSHLAKIKSEALIITDRSNHAALQAASKNGTAQAICIPQALGGKKTRPADLYTPIPYIVPAQLFAACLAEVKGLDPDRPRSLKKVTRTL